MTKYKILNEFPHPFLYVMPIFFMITSSLNAHPIPVDDKFFNNEQLLIFKNLLLEV